MPGLTRQQRREKADRTTSAATEIIQSERAASDAKSLRLKALREARDAAQVTSAEARQEQPT
jgi:hypothetical protein